MNKIIVTTSWDDGHKLDLRIAKLLKKYNLQGTFYISPKNREFKKSELLTDTEIKQLAKHFEIGAHTMTHPLLPNSFKTLLFKFAMKTLKTLEGKKYKLESNISSKEALNEIKGSKDYLEKLLKKKILSFCYPAGQYDATIKNMTAKIGFAYARTVKEYVFDHSRDPLLSGTSIHVYRHLFDILQRIRFSGWNLQEFNKSKDWEYLAKKMFDYVSENGGVYHLWGHSWLVDEEKAWQKLERVFKFISGKKRVNYVVNGRLPLENKTK